MEALRRIQARAKAVQSIRPGTLALADVDQEP